MACRRSISEDAASIARKLARARASGGPRPHREPRAEETPRKRRRHRPPTSDCRDPALRRREATARLHLTRDVASSSARRRTPLQYRLSSPPRDRGESRTWRRRRRGAERGVEGSAVTIGTSGGRPPRRVRRRARRRSGAARRLRGAAAGAPRARLRPPSPPAPPPAPHARARARASSSARDIQRSESRLSNATRNRRAVRRKEARVRAIVRSFRAAQRKVMTSRY